VTPLGAPPDLRLRLPARAENVGVAREVLRGVGTSLQLPARLLASVLTVVSEALNNVVIHAYDPPGGPLEVEIRFGSELEIRVRDWGRGLVAGVDENAEFPGIGMSMIRTLSERFELRRPPGDGAEVRVSWPTPQCPTPVALPLSAIDTALPGDTVLCARPGPALASPARRFLLALLARARFSVDGLADASLVADELTVRCVPLLQGSHLSLAAHSTLRWLELTLGPLAEGGAERLMRESGRGPFPVLGRLAERLDTEALDDGGEALCLAFAEHR
jgi:anti-sigma regulatory factor (Ser/Thr protein kinase)